ncbi:MAG: ubiquinone biosynthesis regulatory protein kinase UbiB [Betaproteobacteria bacterium]|nr:ubiquinone biosynthesis regulatory protein kinase UbiB [Betaproteobacteria bacterium]
MRVFRLLRILSTVGRHGLDEFIVGRGAWLVRISFRVAFFWADRSGPRGVRLRLAFQELGPIFVKFGQLLSVRPDLIPTDITDELSKLQDSVPPFPAGQVIEELDRTFRKPYTDVFRNFNLVPVASASVAQVHFAELPDGREVAVKLLRPGIVDTIDKDTALLYTLAGLVERLHPLSDLLRMREVVGEFDKIIHDELDLLREASSMSTVRRNFAGSRILYVPDVYFDWCTREAMVMERIDAIPVNDLETIRAHGIDTATLGRNGVEIFFTQVFRDGFFHADMHPGNIFVARDGRYCGIDYGIMGSLPEVDKNCLAMIFIAFFKRDYKAVALAHIEAGWVPADTGLEEFEGAIRSVCEPIFDKPLKDIYFGKLLLRLFEVGRRFRMDIQPQLVLLQKTLLQVEGLGRHLDPNLDLRRAAQPILERWMSEQMGPRALWRQLRNEAPHWGRLVPELPRLVHKILSDDAPGRIERAIRELEATQRRQTRILLAVAIVLGVMVVGLLVRGM